MSKFYITTPIYYSNAEPHIGSAYPTVAADVLARYHRLRGEEVYYLTGVDEHGQKMSDSAAAANKSPQEFCDAMAAKWQFAWDALDISNDDFIRTTSDRHKDGVSKLLLKLREAEAIYEGKYEGYYCKGCEAFVTEKDLVDGNCPVHQSKPELIEEKNYFFNLRKYLPAVERLIDTDQIRILPASKKKEVLGLFKQELSDFSISRQNLKWGIPLPWDPTQVAYVWADALSNYINALGYGSSDESKLDKFWPVDVHVIGKDIIKFHCIFWPAMLLAAEIQPPQVVFAHGFFTVDGQKMGKSLGNIIDPLELIKGFGADAVRYLLLSQFPFGQDGDIKADKFVTQYNSDLANGIGNFASRVTAMAEKYFTGLVLGRDSELKAATENIIGQYNQAMSDFLPDNGIEAVKALVALGDAYVEKNKPWELAKTDIKRLEEVIYNLLELLRHVGVLLWPIMPETAEKILAALGQGDFFGQDYKTLTVWGLLEPQSKVEKIAGLFPRIQ
ncbi:MAG: methionine--tRNA ligase [Patescibacteria group bacterium]|jgi:methionyl-tRNA synthetase